MTNERMAELIDKVQKADTFEKLREVASDATSTELREVFKELTGATGMHYTPSDLTEDEKARVDWEVYKYGVWKKQGVGPFAEPRIWCLLVHSGNINWDPFIFTDKSSAEKFYTINKKAATREYRVIYDLTRQTAELGLSTDTAKLDWSDNYQIVARAMY